MPRTKFNGNRNGNGRKSSRTRRNTIELSPLPSVNSSVSSIPNPGGCPTKFRPEMIELARNYSLMGASDSDIASFLEIGRRTFYEWQIEYPKFSRAIVEGRELSVANVSKSLYRRALGYETIEREYKNTSVKEMIINPETGEEVEVAREEMRLVREVHKSVASETKAAEIFLYNKTRTLPENMRWRRQPLEVTGKEGKDLIPGQTSDEKAEIVLVAMIGELDPKEMEAIDMGEIPDDK